MNEQLIELIEMYVSARVSNNKSLISLVAGQLNEFLGRHTVLELPPSSQPPTPPPSVETDETTTAE